MNKWWWALCLAQGHWGVLVLRCGQGWSGWDHLLFSLMAVGTPSGVWGGEAGVWVVLWTVGRVTALLAECCPGQLGVCQTNTVFTPPRTHTHHTHTHTHVPACMDTGGFNLV